MKKTEVEHYVAVQACVVTTLYTELRSEGGSSLHKVVDVAIPPFVVQPEALQWGDRTFIRQKRGDHYFYVEGLVFHVVDMPPYGEVTED